jgi:16S rRNA C1402 (ribose-2'-O) methylase RsmI
MRELKKHNNAFVFYISQMRIKYLLVKMINVHIYISIKYVLTKSTTIN